jgi:hypothetical protein
MAKNEKTGGGIGSIASKAMQNPGSLTNKEIRSLGASALTQRPDKPSGGKSGKGK